MSSRRRARCRAAADAFIKAALRFVLREAHRAGHLQLASIERSRDRLRA